MSDDFKLFEFLPFQFFVLSALTCEQLKDIYSKYGIENNKEWRIIALLNEYGRMSMSRIASESFIDPVNVTRSVESLFQKNYCDRFYDTEDRRRVDVQLSEQGKEVMAKLIPDLRAFEVKFNTIVGQSLSEEMRTKYQPIFDRLADNHKPKIN